MKLITKLRHGLPLVPAILAKLDEIVDYLLATRLVQGPGVQLSEDANGVVISVTGISRSRKDDDYAFVTAGPGICISGTSETPAVSGSTNSTVPLDGSTISLLLEPGTSNVSITDGQNGSKVISVTGSTVVNNGIGYPNFALLAASGGRDVVGIGTTYLIPVPANTTIGFATEGSNDVMAKYATAVGVSGQTSFYLEEGETYPTPADGWVRVSVLDSGTNAGRCLRFMVGGVDWGGALALYKFGTFQNLTGDGTSIRVQSGTISYIGGMTAGICYPDYAQLGVVTGSPSSDVRGTGTTYLLPVYAGISVKWYSSGSNVFARYAPGVGISGTTASDIAKDTDFPVLANGWVRISVIDEGTTENSCLRFYVNNNDATSYLSLYRYNKFQRLRGDGSTIAVNGDVISYIGGNQGGGSVGFPNWGWSPSGPSKGNATSIIEANVAGSTVSSNGWIYAFAEFRTTSSAPDGTASAHVVVNGGYFKVASLRSSIADEDVGAVQRFGAGSSVVIPVLAGSTVSFVVSNPEGLGETCGCVYYAV